MCPCWYLDVYSLLSSVQVGWAFTFLYVLVIFYGVSGKRCFMQILLPRNIAWSESTAQESIWVHVQERLKRFPESFQVRSYLQWNPASFLHMAFLCVFAITKKTNTEIRIDTSCLIMIRLSVCSPCQLKSCLRGLRVEYSMKLLLIATVAFIDKWYDRCAELPCHCSTPVSGMQPFLF